MGTDIQSVLFLKVFCLSWIPINNIYCIPCQAVYPMLSRHSVYLPLQWVAIEYSTHDLSQTAVKMSRCPT